MRHACGGCRGRRDTGSAWTARHRDWLTRLDLGAGAQITLLDYLGAIDALVIRRNTLETTIAELVPGSPWAQTCYCLST